MRVLVTSATGFVGRHVVDGISVGRPPDNGSSTGSEKAEVFYQKSDFYHPESARGVQWDNPIIGIAWQSN